MPASTRINVIRSVMTSGVSALLLLSAAACSTPHPSFLDAARHEVDVGGSRFVIYEKQGWVEVYRTSFERLPPRDAVFARARQAIEQATNCRVVPGSLTGDVALMRARLDC